ITGREELGFSKIYCELPEPRMSQGLTHCTASWMGFRFMDMKIRGLRKLSQEEMTESLGKRSSDGTLHYKYIPKTGDWGKPDVSCFTLTPSGGSNAVIREMYRGEGTVRFHESTWEELPTLFYIVNALHDLEIKEYLGADVVKSVGGKDLGDQRILR
ncbi:MAG: acetoacetate decarboxylase family protein, partial [Candidatus Bathyarchaeota archaeon]|nr:acetoacetate decarboxylase family protein [Candidatus Bathyarchaeota archaeon]